MSIGRKGSAIAEEAIARIAPLHAVEKAIRGSPPEERVRARQEHAVPVLDALQARLAEQLPALSGKTPLAAAVRHALNRLPRLRPYLSDGALEIDDNAAERAMRGCALGRKNWLFAGSAAGGKALAIAATLIETAKLATSTPTPGSPTPSPAPRTTRSPASTNSCPGTTEGSSQAGRLR
jgi:hypothetical protein